MLFVATLGLVGCGQQAVDPNGNSKPSNQIYGNLKRVQVEGVDCVVYDAHGGGAISCDWNTATPTP